MSLAIDIKVLIAILCVILVLLAGAAFVFFYYTLCNKYFNRIFRRPKPVPQVDRSPKKIEQKTINGRGLNWFYTNRMEFLNVRIKSFDGAPLCAYFRPSSDRDSKNVAILIHGYDEHPAEMAAYAKLLMKKMQCHVLIIHQRAHLMSAGKFCSYGLLESVDLDSWFNFVKRRVGADCRIYLMGRGMGAVAALLASQQKEFSENVCGIIADSPYESLETVVTEYALQRDNIKAELYLPTIRKLAQKKLRFDTKMCDCAVHADRTRVPVLLFVGGNDSLTAPNGCQRIFDNLRSAKRLVVVDHADHFESYDKAQALYEKEVQRFIERCVVRLVKMGRM